MKNKLIVILFVILFLLTGCKAKIDDSVKEEDKNAVAEECRKMIVAWEADEAVYLESKDIDPERAEEARMSANKTAESYNEYLAKHEYVFNGKLPEDIYAAIELIGE